MPGRWYSRSGLAILQIDLPGDRSGDIRYAACDRCQFIDYYLIDVQERTGIRRIASAISDWI